MKRVLLLIILALPLFSIAYATEPTKGGLLAAPTDSSAAVVKVGAPTTAPAVATASANAQPAPAKTLKTNRKLTVSMFLAIIASTMIILVWSSGKNKTASDYYAAGGGISGLQNGWQQKDSPDNNGGT